MAVWAKIYTSLRDHPKALEAGHQAMWIYVSMILFAKERDTSGFVPASFVSASCHGRAPLRAVSRLVTVGFVHEVDGGWQIAKYDEKQGEAASVSAFREKKREQKRKERAAKKENVASDTPEPVAVLEQSRAEQSIKVERVSTEASSATSSFTDLTPQPVVAREAVDAVVQIWNAYPHRRRNLTDTQLADRIEQTADLETSTLEQIRAALAEDVASSDWQREGGRYAPKLSVWIERRQWDRPIASEASPRTIEDLAASADPRDRDVADLLRESAA